MNRRHSRLALHAALALLVVVLAVTSLRAARADDGGRPRLVVAAPLVIAPSPAPSPPPTATEAAAPPSPTAPDAGTATVSPSPTADATATPTPNATAEQSAAPASTRALESPALKPPTDTAPSADATLATAAMRRWGSGQLLLAIPRLGVTAAVTGLGFEADGHTLASPTTAWGVGWYQFTGYPGGGGNAVLAGHVDWYTGAPAAFAGLHLLGAGDHIDIILPGGATLVYAVASSQWVNPATADVHDIIGPTGRDAVTLITCGGAWDTTTHDYTQRLIVRAYRAQ